MRLSLSTISIGILSLIGAAIVYSAMAPANAQRSRTCYTNCFGNSCTTTCY